MDSGWLNSMRKYYEEGNTRTYEFRKKQLQQLKEIIQRRETEIEEALYKDLKKSPAEVLASETGLLLGEINRLLANLESWMQPRKVSTNMINLPSSSYIHKDPLGVVLIIAPWNYPLNLLLIPLAAAIAGGNCAVLKPSEHAVHTSALITSMMKEIYPEEYIKVVEGDGAEVIPAMMNEFRFDHVFYTGSIPVGRSIYKMAAEKLVPVTLELGGKSPAIVTADANIKVSARRIVLGKFLNAGQTCVAPDYVLVHESIKAELLHEMIVAIEKFYGKDPFRSDDYGRIIHAGRFNALRKYLSEGKIIHGGQTDEASNFIAPTLLTEINMDSPIMQEEIFGPILPVLTFSTLNEAKDIISKNPDPLALYLFSSDVQIKKDWMTGLSFGGGCVNNTAWHLANDALPFGGVGNSGFGNYHGKYSFNTFTREKSVMETPVWPDPDLKYPPFKNKKKLLRFFMK